jgi:G3E family GTPase
LLTKLNPEAKIVHSIFGKVSPSDILNTSIFNYEKASHSAGWAKELAGEHTPETEQYGITSFVYRRDRPFHPERFSECLKQEWEGVVRSKGFFWLASRPRLAGMWSQAGGSCRTEPAGFWAARGEDGALISSEAAFVAGKQELVLIGIEMKQNELISMLDQCLLTDEELSQGENGWRKMTDPFSSWTIQEESGDQAEAQ